MKWTKQEDEVIINYVKNNIGNLQDAFKKAELTLTNRNSNAICKRWYKSLRPKKEIITLNSSNKSLSNIKNEKSTLNSDNLKSKVITSLIDSMSKDEKISLLKQLIG